jgi:hypothetical protein
LWDRAAARASSPDDAVALHIGGRRTLMDLIILFLFCIAVAALLAVAFLPDERRR